MDTDRSTFEAYAIFETGGKQYQAVPGKTLAVEKLDAEAGESITFEKVLMKRTPESCVVGKPYVEGVQLKASIVKHTRGPKLIAFKFKRRKKCRVKKGHRQDITVIRIESI
ncbi:50S ribosomal protein L21 [bacterium]|nr:50S ribosomal protein L21 [bacterium]